jgi:hypothetical protein
MAKAKADSTVTKAVKSKAKKTKTKTEPVKVKVAKPVEEVTVLLRNANTGAFYQGKRPNKTPNGTNGGVPFWEV